MKKYFRIIFPLILLILLTGLAGCSFHKEGKFGSASFSISADSDVITYNGKDADPFGLEPDQGDRPSADASDRTDTKEPDPEPEVFAQSGEEQTLDRDGSYTSKEDVALYIHIYGELPKNFITKKEARALGWENGSLEPYAPGMCIGGDWFGNYEGLLPEEEGREYHECDIDTLGKKKRGAKRLIYSNDGLIYYTEDHYESFTLLYGEEV